MNLKSAGGMMDFKEKAPDKKKQKFSQMLKKKMPSPKKDSGMMKLMRSF